MRGFSITVYSDNIYRVGDYQIQFLNPRKRFNWPYEWRFITASSQARIIGLMAHYSVSADFVLDPSGDRWYCTNSGSTRLTFVRG